MYYLCECGILGALKTVLAIIISSCSTIYSYIFISIHYTYEVGIRMCENGHCMGYRVQTEGEWELDTIIFLSQIHTR